MTKPQQVTEETLIDANKLVKSKEFLHITSASLVNFNSIFGKTFMYGKQNGEIKDLESSYFAEEIASLQQIIDTLNNLSNEKIQTGQLSDNSVATLQSLSS